MRIENNGTRYFSFSELPGVSKKTKTKEYSEKEKNKFLGECKVCKQPLHFINGTNVIACTNPNCNGYKHVFKNDEGEEKTVYSPVFRVLNEKNTAYAERLFKEEQ